MNVLTEDIKRDAGELRASMIVFCSDTRQNGIVVVKCRGVRQQTDSIQIVTEAVRFRVVPKIDACWIPCVSRKMLRTTMLTRRSFVEFIG